MSVHQNSIMDDHLKIAIHYKIDEFMVDKNQSTLSFPASLDKEQRAYIHEYIKDKQLVSKSCGNGANRQLILTKSESNIEIEALISFNLTPLGRKLCFKFLQDHPLTSYEIDELRLFTGVRKRKNAAVNLGCNLHKHQISSVPTLRYNPDLKKLRENLPIFAQRQRIIETIQCSQVVIVTGAPGAGKSTQLPQYILEHYAETGQQCRMICTQRHPLAAISISKRVVDERGEKMGLNTSYQVRLESHVSDTANLVYTTTSYLLRCLISEPENELFSALTHIILDGVHERDKYTDFVLIAIKKALFRNPTLKVVLLSATIDTGLFSSYFGGCPVIDIPDNSFVVSVYTLESTLALIGYTESMEQTSKEFYESLQNTSTSNRNLGESETQHQSVVNQVLDDCFQSEREESFDEFVYLVNEESVSVDVKHSRTMMTALMLASSKGYLDVVKTLISMGADPHVVGRSDMNAFQWACQMRKIECAEYLMTIPSLNPIQSYQAKHSGKQIDHFLICELVKYIHINQPKGGILIFLPGYDTMVELNDILLNYITQNDLDGQLSIVLMHTSLPAKTQTFCHTFQYSRTIILSTNIVENTATVDETAYVIDTGKVQQRTIDQETGTSSLVPAWISQACAKQRMCRAGRVRPGLCFRLYTQNEYDQMDQYKRPEIWHISLTDVCTYAKILSEGLSINEFLSQAIQPPSSAGVAQSIRVLKRIGALDEQENVTELGTTVIDFPVDMRLGKTLVYAVLLKCLDPVLTIISALHVGDPFILPVSQNERQARRQRKLFACNSESDHMILLKIYQEWNENKSKNTDGKFCRENFINNGCMHMIGEMRGQLLAHLRSLGLIQHRSQGNIHDLNIYSENWAMVKACLTAGLYPNLCHIDRMTGKITSRLDNKMVSHPTSLLRDKNAPMDLPTDWVLFYDTLKTGQTYMIRQNTMVSPLNVALFAGPIYLSEMNLIPFRDGSDSENDDEPDGMQSGNMTKLIVDEWITCHLTTTDAYLIHHLRQKFNTLLVKIVQNPKMFVGSILDSEAGGIDMLAKLLLIGEKSCGLVQPYGVGQRPMGLMSSVEAKQRVSEPPPVMQPSDTDATTHFHPIENNNWSNTSTHRPVASNLTQLVETPKYEINPYTSRFFVIHAVSAEQILQYLHTPMSWYWPKEILDQLIVTNSRYASTDLILLFFIPSKMCFGGVGLFRCNSNFYHQCDVVSLKTVPMEQLRSIWFKPYPGRGTKTFDQTEQGEEISDRMAAKILLNALL